MSSYNAKVKCIQSMSPDNAIVGKTYTVRDGYLYTELEPCDREQPVKYNSINDVNTYESSYGYMFEETNE